MITSLLSKKRDKMSKRLPHFYECKQLPIVFDLEILCGESLAKNIVKVSAPISSHHYVDVQCPCCEKQFPVAAIEYMYGSDKTSFVGYKQEPNHEIRAVKSIDVLFNKLVTSFWELG